MSTFKIPVYRPSLHGNEKKYVNECLDSTWISSKGKFVGEFEAAFANYIGMPHATSVSNGTAALHVALVALGIGPGDEVIVPTLTYIASANAVTYTGAKVVFADSEPTYWQIDPEDVERKITPATKAVMAVHLYGHACDMDALQKICKKHGLFLLEDCAEAIGTTYKGKHVGGFGDIAAFSFFGNKCITTGEGGMVVTGNETLHDRVIHFKGQGLAKHREYWHDVIGYNYRMTNICAAIGLAQLERIDEMMERKLRLAEFYREKLKALSLVFHPQAPHTKHAYWMCTVLTKTAAERDPLRHYMAEAGIETRPVFFPIHTMPMYASKYEQHKNAENIGWRGINLPSFPDLTTEEMTYVVETIAAFYAQWK